MSFRLTERERVQMEREWREDKERERHEVRERRIAEGLVRQIDGALSAEKEEFNLIPEVGFDSFYDHELPEGEAYPVRLSSGKATASDLQRIAANLRARSPKRPTIKDVGFNWWPFEIAAEMLQERKVKTQRPGRPPRSKAQRQQLVHLRDHCNPRWPLTDLASKFLDQKREHEDPEGAISQALTRARPEADPREKCTYCKTEDWSQPPSLL